MRNIEKVRAGTPTHLGKSADNEVEGSETEVTCPSRRRIPIATIEHRSTIVAEHAEEEGSQQRVDKDEEGEVVDQHAVV